MLQRYGQQQVAQHEWLMNHLQQARRQRLQQLEFETRRSAAVLGAGVEAVATGAGAVIGGRAGAPGGLAPACVDDEAGVGRQRAAEIETGAAGTAGRQTGGGELELELEL